MTVTVTIQATVEGRIESVCWWGGGGGGGGWWFVQSVSECAECLVDAAAGLDVLWRRCWHSWRDAV